MDPFNQWGDENKTETHEMNERDPINYNQNYNQNSYMTNDARETSVESLNIDSMQAKQSQRNNDTRKSYHYEVPKDTNFWKYMEQIKSILAGLLLLFCGGMHTVWGIYQMVMFDSSAYFRKHLKEEESKSANETVSATSASPPSTNSSVATPNVASSTAASLTATASRLTAEKNSTGASHSDIFKEFQRWIYPNGVLLKLTIIMWYVGIMLGCFLAGWFLVRIVQKKNIYYVAALLMFISGCICYGAGVESEDDPYWQSLILFGRFTAGISYGITYVTVIVQAGENAARDFRRILATIIGLTIAFSMLIAVLFVVPIPMPLDDLVTDHKITSIMKRTELPAMSTIWPMTIALSFFSVVINYLFSHETVPFLLYHNYREDEAIFMLSKLLGEDQNSPIVQQEFLGIRELCNDDYTEYPEGKIFTTIHRKLMMIPLSARIASAQCLNILYIILIAKYLVKMIDKEAVETVEDFEESGDILDKKFVDDISKIADLASDYKVVVRSEISAWFGSGLLFSLLGNFFNWRRGLHFTTFLTGAIMLTYFIVSFTGSSFLHALSMLVLFIYIHCLSLPIDILGYTYLMECFPLSTKAKAIGFVTICECILNSFYATLELKVDDVFIEYFLTGLIYFVLGFKLYCTVPNTHGLSLGAAKHAYIQSAFNLVWWKEWIPKRFYPASSSS